MFARWRVNFTYGGRYTYIEGQQDVPLFSWPKAATEDSVAAAACEYLQTNYMPEDVVVIAVQSVTWMGHDWPEAKVKIKETSRTDYVMVYRGVAPESADVLIDQQRRYAELKVQVRQQEDSLRRLEHAQEESQSIPRQARYFMSN